MTTALESVSPLPPRVSYSELNGKQKEIYNFQKVAALLADHGFNCIKLSDDWQGADFLAYHKDGVETLRVQLKGRLELDRKYVGKGLHLAFPARGRWYVVEHDFLVGLCGEHTSGLKAKSWIEGGWYNTATPNKALLEHLERFALGDPVDR